ncbi:unnamed protein product, partial [Dicrocoelium dendriticum]
MCHIFGTRKTRMTACIVEGNGLIECTNRTMKALLQAFLIIETPRECDTALPKCLLAYRASVHSSTGQIPPLIMTSHELRLSSATLLSASLESNRIDACTSATVESLASKPAAQAHLQISQRHQKVYFDPKAFGSLFMFGDT